MNEKKEDRLQALMKRYGEQCEEWQAIAKELVANCPPGDIVTAYKVTREQKSRLLARGEQMITYEDLESTWSE